MCVWWEWGKTLDQLSGDLGLDGLQCPLACPPFRASVFSSHKRGGRFNHFLQQNVNLRILYDLNLGIYIWGEEKDNRVAWFKILVLTEETEGEKARISRLTSQDSSRDTVLESWGGARREGAGAEPGLGWGYIWTTRVKNWPGAPIQRGPDRALADRKGRVQNLRRHHSVFKNQLSTC